jgi:putative integral membrane protein (TIGR02587 family)
MVKRTIPKSLKEYARGITGGLIFSLPLLFTMEVWWAGFTANYLHLVVYMVFTFALLIGYNFFAGLRKDSCLSEVLIDSVEEMGIGIMMSAFILWLLDRIYYQMDPAEAIGKIVVEGMIVAIGVSIGTAQLGDDDEQDKDDGGMESGGNDGKPSIQKQVVLSICGAVIFAANVAPTEEIVILGYEIQSWKLLLVVVLSLTFSSIILHFSSFKGSFSHSIKDELPYIAGASMMAYTVALIVSTLVLWFYGRLTDVSLSVALSQIIILSIPSSLGASAGRLLLK